MYGTEKSFSSNNNRPKKIFFVLFETEQLKCVPVVCVYAVTFSAVIAGLYFPLFVLCGGNIHIDIYTYNTIPITCIHLHQLLISIKMSGSMNSCLWVIKINNNFSYGLQYN